MHKKTRHLRVATYNVHKCRGMDRRVRPERIAKVLSEINADVVALQEVLSIEGGDHLEDQAEFLAKELGYHFQMGENRRLKGGAYGNLLLSRFPLLTAYNYDLSVSGRERRGCLRADIEIEQAYLLHVFNIHLGTAFLERRHQGRELIGSQILNNKQLTGSRLVLGDFNEWVRGLTSRLLSSHFESVDVRKHLSRSRTYPGLLPFLHLDHIYFDPALQLEQLTLHRTRLSLIASDHLPFVADFNVRAPEAPSLPV